MDSSEVFHATQFELLPVTSEAVARETRRDPILARVYEYIVKGWSIRIDVSHDQNVPYIACMGVLTQLTLCLVPS